MNQTNNAEAKMYFGTLAADSLYADQLHNPDVVTLYRACFRDNPEGLFQLVMEVPD